MVLNTSQKQKLRKFITDLSKIRGRHTELVSVYIPAGFDLNKVTQQLSQEQSTAANIKDKTTRTHVMESIEKMIRHLKLYKKTPENGLAVFSGDISDNPSKTQVEAYSIEPPEPIQTRLYRCDQTFVLDPLKEMMEVKEVYALLVMDKREATLGILKGTRIDVLQHLTSYVPGKFKAGGQCHVYGTLVNLTDNSSKKIEDLKIGDEVKSFNFKMNKFESSRIIDKWKVKKDQIYSFTTENDFKIQSSKEHNYFVFKENKIAEQSAELLKIGDCLLVPNEDSILPIQIKDIKIINKKVEMIDISVKNQNFIANGIITHNSSARFQRLREEAVKEFFVKIGGIVNNELLPIKTNIKGIILGGPGMTKTEFYEADYMNRELKDKVKAIEDITYTDETGLHHLVDKAQSTLAKEHIIEEKKILEKFFQTLAKEERKTAYGYEKVKKALEMGAVATLLISETLEEDKIIELETLAEQMSTEVKIISTDTKEGQQLRDLGKVAAILRYEI